MSDTFTAVAIKHISLILDCNADSIGAEDTIETIDNWDSLNHMRLILHLEEELGRMIDTEDTLTLFSVTGIANYLKNSS
ncbi:MAG: acyl carrier protein [Sneathiella sp.]